RGARMRSLRVEDGDLVLGGGRRAQVVELEDKLLQDLRMWLLEPLGTNPLAPNFGSTLSGMIGMSDPDALGLEVETEVERILGLYQQTQLENIQYALNNGLPFMYSRREILNTIEDVTAEVVGTSIK